MVNENVLESDFEPFCDGTTRRRSQADLRLVVYIYRYIYIYTLLKIKVLHDTIEEPFCLNGSIKNLQHLKNLSVSQKVLCGERRFFRL